MALKERTKILLLAPVVRGKKGRHEKVLEQARKSGYVRVRIDGSQYDLEEEITLDKNITVSYTHLDVYKRQASVQDSVSQQVLPTFCSHLHFRQLRRQC